jgi:hypothetical protein
MGIRWSWVAAVAGFCILVPSRKIAQPEWLKADGHVWRSLSPESKEAYLAGFLAGTALTQALEHGAADSAGLVHHLDSLSRSGFRFPYAPTVYGARLEDYYWYEDHRSLPIWHALLEVNHRLTPP